VYIKRLGQICSTFITVIDNYIFDSSVGRSLNLTKENLDWCCGSDYQQVEFVCAEKAYRFIKKYASTQIVIRKRKGIYCAFNSIIRLFHYMDEFQICQELKLYQKNRKVEEDFLTSIIKMLFTKPHLYSCKKIQQKNFKQLICSQPREPMILLLSNNYNSYRLVTVNQTVFFDGSKNPPYNLTENELKTLLRWETTSLENVLVLREYYIYKSNYKMKN
jgi:hypothetical protein